MVMENFSAESSQEEGVEELEAVLGKIQAGPMQSEQFPGSDIFNSKKEDGEFVQYALRRSPSGELEGNKFTIQRKEDGGWVNSAFGLPAIDNHDDTMRIGPTYQMHQPELEKIEALLKSKGIVI
jgi:hypothetical protein